MNKHQSNRSDAIVPDCICYAGFGCKNPYAALNQHEGLEHLVSFVDIAYNLIGAQVEFSVLNRETKYRML